MPRANDLHLHHPNTLLVFFPSFPKNKDFCLDFQPLPLPLHIILVQVLVMGDNGREKGSTAVGVTVLLSTGMSVDSLLWAHNFLFESSCGTLGLWEYICDNKAGNKCEMLSRPSEGQPLEKRGCTRIHPTCRSTLWSQQDIRPSPTLTFKPFVHPFNFW